MTAPHPLVPLSELLVPASDWVPISPELTYKEITVRLWGRGVALRGEVQGAAIASATRHRAHAGQFIVSRIDARNGAFGVIPPELEGAVVTNDFPLFNCRAERIDPKFLGWMSRTSWFVKLCKDASEGTTNRVRLKEERFLTALVPLPSIQEQRHIVEMVQEVASRIHDVQLLQKETRQDSEELLIALAHRNDWGSDKKQQSGWRRARLHEVIRLETDPQKVAVDQEYRNCGIYSYAKGLFTKPAISGTTTSASVLYRIHSGQFIYSRLFAFEGAYGMVTPEFHGCFVSNEYPTFDCDTQRVIPEFLWAYFKSPQVWSKVAIGSKGIGHRRQRVPPERILEHELWLPPIGYQRRIAETIEAITRAIPFHNDLDSALNELLPSIIDSRFKGAEGP